MKRQLNQTLSGNKVDYPNSFILGVKNMLRSKFHCQNGFHLIPFACVIRPCECNTEQGYLAPPHRTIEGPWAWAYRILLGGSCTAKRL